MKIQQISPINSILKYKKRNKKMKIVKNKQGWWLEDSGILIAGPFLFRQEATDYFIRMDYIYE